MTSNPFETGSWTEFRSLSACHSVGELCYDWAKELFPICRSISGNGVRQTLNFIKTQLPDLTIHEVPSGTQVFDWTVPDEWNIADAWLEHEDGTRVLSFTDNNLHVVGYSEPVDAWLDLEELQEHLHSIPEMPDIIPAVTSYYKRTWGFCISENQRQAMKKGRYRAFVNSTLESGHLTFGELLIKGRKEKEVFLSTYVCHPSLANDNLSGVVLLTALAREISARQPKYSYRIVFAPETIGAIAYLARNLDRMKDNVISGFNISCVGDEGQLTFMPSRYGNTLADRASRHVLSKHFPGFEEVSFLDRASDERQYCSVGVDLPVVSIARSRHARYPEYHTSDDNLDLISAKGLAGSFQAHWLVLAAIEANAYYRTFVSCEPQMGKRGLYPSVSRAGSALAVRPMMNVIAYADGRLDLFDLAEAIGQSALDVAETVSLLCKHDVMAKFDQPYGPG